MFYRPIRSAVTDELQIGALTGMWNVANEAGHGREDCRAECMQAVASTLRDVALSEIPALSASGDPAQSSGGAHANDHRQIQSQARATRRTRRAGEGGV